MSHTEMNSAAMNGEANVRVVTDYQTLTFEQSGPIVRIVLNRPDAANGMNDEMTRELAAVARRCDSSGTKVVITGSGRSLCAGGDLKVVATSRWVLGRSSRPSPTTCTGRCRPSPGWTPC